MPGSVIVPLEGTRKSAATLRCHPRSATDVHAATQGDEGGLVVLVQLEHEARVVEVPFGLLE